MNGLRLLRATKRPAALAAGIVAFVLSTAIAGAVIVVNPTKSPKPPAISVDFPINGRSYNAQGWVDICSGGGICGTASDPDGVAQITVAVRKLADGKYWNGSGFTSTTAVYLAAQGTNSWKLPLVLPPDGGYQALVKGRDGKGLATSDTQAVKVSFTIDTAAPAAPSFNQNPPLITDLLEATFGLIHAEVGVSLKCTLDGNAQETCKKPHKYTHLAIGDHCLTAVAVDAALNTSARVWFCWTIVAKGFPISGDPNGTLYPGVVRPIDLKIKNPYTFKLRVTDSFVTIQDRTLKDGAPNPACHGNTNMRVARHLLADVDIPAGQTRTLSQLGVPQSQWPAVEMINLATNQDACQNTKFTLVHSGTGRSV